MRQLSRLARKRALDGSLGIVPALDDILDEQAEQADAARDDEHVLRDQVLKSVTGFAFLQPYLDDPAIEEVWINRPGEIRYAKDGVHRFDQVDFEATELQTLVERMVRQSGRRLDRSSPFIDAQLESGYRLHAVIPDITRKHMCLNIRKFSKNSITSADLVSAGVLSTQQLNYLLSEVQAGSNLLISGATQAGKTTMLAALLNSLDSRERVVSVEDTFELKCLLPDWVAMQTRPASTEGKFEVDIRRLVKETLRMRPTRLVVGEVRGAEALDMLIAMNSGIPGLCTIHANSAEEALKKLQTLPLLAGGNISSLFLDSIIESSMKLFVHCRRSADGSRRIDSIKQMSADLKLVEVNL